GEAQEWLARHGGEMGTSANLAALVEASRAARRLAEERKEAAQRRELEQAQALATTKRRQVRNLGWALAAVGVLLLATAGTARYAWGKDRALRRAEEDQRRQHAESHARLATEAARRGSWRVALSASEEALKDGDHVPDERELRLLRVKSLVALNLLTQAHEELSALARRTDL